MDDVLTEPIRKFLGAQGAGVLAVHRRDGTVHQSVVRHLFDDDRIWISTESKRLKGRAVARDGWASYCVHGGEPPYPALTVEGPAVLHREGIAERTGALFALIFGKPVDPPLTDEGLAAMDRVLIELTPANVYAMSYVS